MTSCCACNEANVFDPEDYSDHDELCKLLKYRCGLYECEWCDLCDALDREPQDRKSMTADWSHDDVSYKLYKSSKPRPPIKDALDLPTTGSESF